MTSYDAIKLALWIRQNVLRKFFAVTNLTKISPVDIKKEKHHKHAEKLIKLIKRKDKFR